MMCIQETRLKPNSDFIIKGSTSTRKDRDNGNGGGCAIFMKEGINYRQLTRERDLEVVVSEVWYYDKLL